MFYNKCKGFGVFHIYVLSIFVLRDLLLSYLRKLVRMSVEMCMFLRSYSAQVQTGPKRSKPEKKDYTLEELKQFDGSNPTSPILMAVKGKIYDVSGKEEFYGPGFN